MCEVFSSRTASSTGPSVYLVSITSFKYFNSQKLFFVFPNFFVSLDIILFISFPFLQYHLQTLFNAWSCVLSKFGSFLYTLVCLLSFFLHIYILRQ